MFLRSEKIMQMLPMNNGLFVHINYDFPSVLSVVNSELDLNFLTLYGLKTCAPVIHVVHQDHSVSQLTDSELTTLAHLILSTYKWKWDKLAAIIELEYDPIHNYSDDYHEELSEDINSDSTRTPNITETSNGTLSRDIQQHSGGSEREVTTQDEESTRTDNLAESTERTDDLAQDTTRTLNTRKATTKEVETSDDTVRTDDLSETLTRTLDTDKSTSRTDNLTETISEENENNLFGFNSDEAVGADTGASNKSRRNTGSVTGSETETGTITDERDNEGSVSTNRDISTTENGSETDTGTITDAQTNTGTVTTERTNTGTVGNVQQSSSETTRYGGLSYTTDDDHTSQGTKRTTGTEATEGSSERTRVRDFTHLGNIGNHTTQQLLTEEIELWRWNFIQQVFNDVKDFLTLPLYD